MLNAFKDFLQNNDIEKNKQEYNRGLYNFYVLRLIW